MSPASHQREKKWPKKSNLSSEQLSRYDRINAEINEEPIIESSSLTEKISNALTASCDLKDEPDFCSLKQSFDEPQKRYRTKRSLSTCQHPSEWATGPNTNNAGQKLWQTLGNPAGL